MTAISRSLIRDVGSLTQVTWPGDPSALGYARIRSYSGATFSGIGVGNTFSINRNGAGATLITPAGTEASIADMVTTINTAMGATVAYSSGGRLELRGSTSIAVTGASAATFAKIGLPNSTRTTTATQTSIAAPPDVDANEMELLSNAITVPAGCNCVVLDIGLTSAASMQGGLLLLPLFATSAVGSSPATMIDGVIATLPEGSLVVDTDDLFGKQKLRAGELTFASSLDGGTVWRSVVLEVPPHRTALRLGLAGSFIESTSVPPATPPTVQAYVGFGVR
jgi:hypothetical protein